MSGAAASTATRAAAVTTAAFASVSAAVTTAVRRVVPRSVRRLVSHEITLYTSLLRRLVLRRPHGVGEGDTAVPYDRAQSAIMYAFLFVSVVETVVLAYLIPWPLVHRVLLILGVWGIFFVLGMQAACAVRPHVVGADGSLRVRYGALIDIRVPADRIASARLERRCPTGQLLQVDDTGTLDLIVGSQTTITVELTGPVTFLRPLGRPVRARTLRFHADDPAPAVAALSRARQEREERE